MKLYHYAPLENSVLEQGLLSIRKAPKDLVKTYGKRIGCEDKEEVLRWLESTFEGRSRSVSCLTQTIKHEGNAPFLKDIADNATLFSFELETLIKDGIVEAIYCKNGSHSDGTEEVFYKVSYEEIDCSELPWYKCNKEKNLLFAVIRHYLLVLKEDVIPPKYLTKES